MPLEGRQMVTVTIRNPPPPKREQSRRAEQGALAKAGAISSRGSSRVSMNLTVTNKPPVLATVKPNLRPINARATRKTAIKDISCQPKKKSVCTKSATSVKPSVKTLAVPVKQSKFINIAADVVIDVESDIDVRDCDSLPITPARPVVYVDPDIGNEDDPQQCFEYVNEIYAHLLLTERRGVYKHRRDHLSHHVQIKAQHRAVLVDWLTQVHVKFGLLDDTLYMCVAILDRALQVSLIASGAYTI